MNWRSTRNGTQTLLIESWMNRIVRPKHFSPCFLQKHNPNLVLVRLSRAKYTISVDRKTQIHRNRLPYTINEKSDSVQMSWILVQHKESIHKFRVSFNNGRNGRHQITISKSSLNDILWLKKLTQTLAVFVSMNYRFGNFEQTVIISDHLGKMNVLICFAVGRRFSVNEKCMCFDILRCQNCKLWFKYWSVIKIGL